LTPIATSPVVHSTRTSHVPYLPVQLPGATCKNRSCASRALLTYNHRRENHILLTLCIDADARPFTDERAADVFKACFSDGQKCFSTKVRKQNVHGGELTPGSLVRLVRFNFVGTGAGRCAYLARAPQPVWLRAPAHG